MELEETAYEDRLKETVEHIGKLSDTEIAALVLSLKDERAGCLEPLRQVSGAIGREGVWYYQSPKTASENFFFERLPQGTFVIEYSTYVTRAGEYAAGPSTLQCLYAPEFVAYGRGSVLNVE